MSEQWSWKFENAEGADVADSSLPSDPFPTQADAEAYLSEGWAELSDAGVAQVSLMCDGEIVYGPMSLEQD
ncbi:hypothetical protein [Gephyromycinifex aptenodytis]|uniref:hypothetical protein n=1 Tax=Gephyromycinifex aptenodytis TaxID=2716227 RepID=UPI001445F01B|nr:hypothetical protein [Gephyromycinifex aptenodytis]